jgi:uncharacterized protein YxeA
MKKWLFIIIISLLLISCVFVSGQEIQKEKLGTFEKFVRFFTDLFYKNELVVASPPENNTNISVDRNYLGFVIKNTCFIR